MPLHAHAKTNRLFLHILFYTALLGILFATALYSSMHIAISSLSKLISAQAQIACGCSSSSEPQTYIIAGTIAGLLSATLIFLFITSIVKTLLSFLKTKKFIRAHATHFSPLSEKLSIATNNTGLQKNIIQINTEQPIIFCQGLISSTIYISSGIVNSLTLPQLQTALLHEKHHAINKEPARLLLIKFLSGFSIIPGIDNITKKYLSYAEIAADEFATNNFAEKNHLAAAMAIILEMEEKMIIQKELSASFFSQITEDRILVLSEKNYLPTTAGAILKTIGGLCAAGTILFLLLYSTKTIQARSLAEDSSGTCTAKTEFKQCQKTQTTCMIDNIFSEEKIDCGKSIRQYFSQK